MFKMRSKSLAGLEMNPVVGAVMIFVGIVAAGAITVMVMPLVNRSKDTRVIESLGAIKTAITLFMVNTNGEAPCFDAETIEGVSPSGAGSACFQGGSFYDFSQGGGSDVDKDGVLNERFTPQNILVSKYLDKIPGQIYGGENFIYTKGMNNNSTNASAFAVSGLLHSDIADYNVVQNTSVLDIVQNSAGSASVFNSNGTSVRSCRSTDLLNGMMFSDSARTFADTIAPDDGGFHYYSVDRIDTTTIKSDFKGSDCDVYSEGQIFQNAFGDTPGTSPSTTINSDVVTNAIT